MTIKGLKDAGFKVEKNEGRFFTISKGKIKAKVEKITDTKFKYQNNLPTPHLDLLLEQIDNKSSK